MQFYILIAFTAVALLAILFLCPEHGAYIRPAKYETDVVSRPDLRFEEKDSSNVSEGDRTQTHEATSPASEREEKPRSYMSELALVSVVNKRQNIFLLAFRPFACFLYPAVFWGFTVGGLWSSWVSI